MNKAVISNNIENQLGKGNLNSVQNLEVEGYFLLDSYHV